MKPGRGERSKPNKEISRPETKQVKKEANGNRGQGGRDGTGQPGPEGGQLVRRPTTLTSARRRRSAGPPPSRMIHDRKNQNWTKREQGVPSPDWPQWGLNGEYRTEKKKKPKRNGQEGFTNLS